MTQGELEKIPDRIVKAMNDLEIRIMDDVVRRIKINGFSTAGADWQVDRLRQLGMSEKEIKEWVRQTMETTEEEIDRIFSDEVYEQYMKQGRGYKAYGREQIPFDENIELQQLIEAVKRQANDEMERITGSMGFVKQGATGKLNPITLSDFYTRTLDDAMYDIHSGAFDYNTVLKRTIEDMTKSGLRWIDYESGWHNRVPVAARRAVMTGFRQVQGKINEQTAEALGTDSYEVTVHIGARPTHQVWEGKIWTMTQLRTVCGLGEVTGLHGANCYHDYNPFIPGVDVPAYSQAELDQIHRQENTSKRYNGKEYTTYEALQRQRKLETRARKYREDVHLLEEGGGSEDDIIAKKCRYQGTLQEYRDFSKKMDLPMQKERIYQDGLKVDMKAQRRTPFASASGSSADFVPDYSSAYSFAKHNNRLTGKLISGNVQEVASAVNEILDGSDYSLPKSQWSGKAKCMNPESMPRIFGKKEWDCSITIREDRISDLKTQIHENLHSRSISNVPANKRRDIYDRWQKVEEGTVELLSQSICNQHGIPYGKSYTEFVDCLKDIHKVISPKESEFDFSKKLIDIPLTKRYSEIKNMVEKYINATPKIRPAVMERLNKSLEILGKEVS